MATKFETLIDLIRHARTEQAHTLPPSADKRLLNAVRLYLIKLALK
jgi:ribosomal 50S subunit-associated protein YjgA (DUF615 family)